MFLPDRMYHKKRKLQRRHSWDVGIALKRNSISEELVLRGIHCTSTYYHQDLNNDFLMIFFSVCNTMQRKEAVSYTHLRAHETA